MDERATCAVLRGQLVLWLLLGVSVSLHPGFVLKGDEGGLSNYGIHIKTAVPYSLAFIASAVFSLKAVHLMHAHSELTRHLRLLLQLFATLMILVLVSTYGYKTYVILNDVHLVVNVCTELFETAAAIWLYRLFRRNRHITMAFAVQLIGFVLIVVNAANIWHLLFVGEILSEIGFGSVLVLVCRSITTSDSSPS